MTLDKYCWMNNKKVCVDKLLVVENYLCRLSWLILVHVHVHWWLWYGFLVCDECNIVWYFKIEFETVNMVLELFGCKIMCPILCAVLF